MLVSLVITNILCQCEKAADSFAFYCSLEYLNDLYLRHWMGICWISDPEATMLHWEHHGRS
jgi:hypothetical protein